MFTLTGDHLREIIRYPFSGKDWFLNVGLQGALLIMLCPLIIGIPFFAGFMIAHTRKGIDGSKEYPGWNDWGLYWQLGWRAFFVNLLYYIPVVILFGVYLIVILIPVLLSIALESEAIAAVSGILGSLGMIVVYPLLMIYVILYAAIQMSTNPKIAAGASFHDAIQWKTFIWPYLKYNALNLLILYLITYLVSVVSMFGIFFLFIGLLFTMPFALAIMGYGQGVIYRLSAVK